MTIQTNDFIKNNFLALIVLIGLALCGIFALKSGCNTPVPLQPKVIKVDSARDTTINRFEVNLPDQNKPQASTTVVPVYAPQAIQPAQDISGLVAQVKELVAQNAQLIQKLGTENKYNDSTELKDSTGFVVGQFRLEEIVKNNELAKRSKSYTVNARTITNTITKTIQEPYKPKVELGIGGGISGEQNDLVNRIAAGIAIKNKAGNIITLNVTGNKNLSIGGEVRFYKKIF